MPDEYRFTWRVDELADAGEVDDLVELPGDLGALHSHDRALEEHVLPAGQVRMKAGRHFDQRASASAEPRSGRASVSGFGSAA